MSPGDLLALMLRDRGITQQEFADAIRRPPQLVSEVVNGKKRVTADTAWQFEAALGVPARVWLFLQVEYDLT